MFDKSTRSKEVCQLLLSLIVAHSLLSCASSLFKVSQISFYSYEKNLNHSLQVDQGLAFHVFNCF